MLRLGLLYGLVKTDMPEFLRVLRRRSILASGQPVSGGFRHS